MTRHRILLVVSGGVAAYKALELTRRSIERGASVRCVMTRAATEFVRPLAFASLSGEKVMTDLFSLTDETEMGHIRLSREADVIVVAPATADLMAKMAHGLADDLASTALLAADKPILLAPAMNPVMWANPATQRNVQTLEADGVAFVGPAAGDMACGEVGRGRMAEPAAILEAVEALLEGDDAARPLAGLSALVTSGPTHEAIDPVRFVGNRSSGKQGHAIAAALAKAGAAVRLVSGPVALPDPDGVVVERVESARDMAAACARAGRVDLAVCAAAVADWRPESVADGKIKKAAGGPPELRFVENPDILKTIASPGPNRPALVIGFAAETDDLERNAAEKLARKGCDWLLANDVGAERGVFGGDHNEISFLRRGLPAERWERADKATVAQKLVEAIVAWRRRRATDVAS